MIGLLEIRCNKNGERVVFGSTHIKQDFIKIAEMLKYGAFPIKAMQYNYDAYLEHGIELSVIAICKRRELLETEQEYLAEWKDDTSLLNERDANGLPVGIAHLDPNVVANDWKKRIIEGKKKYKPVLREHTTQIREIVKKGGVI